MKSFTSLILLFFLLVLGFTNCSRKTFQQKESGYREGSDTSHSKMTPTGETIGHDDVRNIPKK